MTNQVGLSYGKNLIEEDKENIKDGKTKEGTLYKRGSPTHTMRESIMERGYEKGFLQCDLIMKTVCAYRIRKRQLVKLTDIFRIGGHSIRVFEQF